MLSRVSKNAFITPKAISTKHSKHISSQDNIISRKILKKTRNISSSLKVSKTETTANASDSNKKKKNNTIHVVHPFSYLDPPKAPLSTKNIPHTKKTLHINQPSINNSNKENETIPVNSLFKMKNYQTDLLKYSMIKSRITRKQPTKPAMNKLIYAEMNQNFIDKKVSVKSCRDKTLEEESKQAKCKMRFWKGVADSSYPKIFIHKINCSKQYSNRANQSLQAYHKVIDELLKTRKHFSKDHIHFNKPKAIEEKEIEAKRYRITSFNQTGKWFNNSKVNINDNANCSTSKYSIGTSIYHFNCHKRSKAMIMWNE